MSPPSPSPSSPSLSSALLLLDPHLLVIFLHSLPAASLHLLLLLLLILRVRPFPLLFLDAVALQVDSESVRQSVVAFFYDS